MVAAAKRPAPPKPVARKNTEVNSQYEDKAKSLLRNAMTQQGVTPADLSRLLGEIGVEISPGGVANKISRGGFSSAFLYQCMEAMNVNLVALPK